MAKEPLNRYKGRLTPAQIAEGMNAACHNAKELHSAAKLLLEHGHIPLSASVAAIAIEEAGKPTILRSLAIADSEDEAVKCWRDFRNHTRKNVLWLLPQLVSKGARKLDDFRDLFKDGAEHAELLDKVKQIGLYTDCLGNAHWSRPADVIDRDLARMLVSIAGILVREAKHSEAEIRLWVKHMGPTRRASKERAEHGLAQWYAEMQAAGLAPRGKNEMEEFIVSGIKKASGDDA